MVKKKRWSDKRLSDWHRMFLADIRRARQFYPEHEGYLEGLIADPLNLPSPSEVGAWLELTNDQRMRFKLYRILPIDKTKDELVAIRKEKAKERQARRRRKLGMMTRPQYREACRKRAATVRDEPHENVPVTMRDEPVRARLLLVHTVTDHCDDYIPCDNPEAWQ